MQSHIDAPPATESGAVSPQPRGESLQRSQWIALAILGGAVIWTYWPILTSLVKRWEQDDQYSHGYLVPFFSGWLLWQRWGRIAPGPARPAAWGLLLVIAGLAMLAGGQLFFYESLAQIAIIPALAGLTILGGGIPWLRRAWPALAFLVFMIPLPFKIETGLLGPLQGAATTASTVVLQTAGLPAIAVGNTILMDGTQLEVLEQCSGLRMLMTLMALCAAVALSWESRSPLDRILIVLLSVPIALAVNIFRVTFTGMLHQWAGHHAGEVFHEHLAVFVMMPLGLALLGGFLWIWDRLVGPDPDSDPDPEPRATSPAAA